MSGMYPSNQTIEIFGEDIQWPGVGENGKFTNGSFTDPMVKPSFIPAETINLILDNLGNLISYLGLDPNNFDPEQLKKAVHNNRIIGELISFDFEPTPLQLARWRCLPVAGQIIEISQYQDLCDLEYCGDAQNDTADWWYKTSDPEGLERDKTGPYMRVIDRRGVFIRAAGQNSKYRMSNDAPYDGKVIGAYLGDAMRNLYGDLRGILHVKNYGIGGVFKESGAAENINLSTSGSGGIYDIVYLAFDNNMVTPVASENRVASVSSGLYIKY
jgi:hypothetical protein